MDLKEIGLDGTDWISVCQFGRKVVSNYEDGSELSNFIKFG